MIRVEEAFVRKLVSNEIISLNEADIYKFGLECFLLKIIHCISYFIIAVCFQMVPELIVIGSILIPLRRSAGGYHARSKSGCYLFSCCYIAILLFLSEAAIQPLFWWGALVIADAVLYFKSPADNENKRLDKAEVEYFRKKTRYLLLGVNAACVALTALGFCYIGTLFQCAICAAAFLLVLHDLQEAADRFL